MGSCRPHSTGRDYSNNANVLANGRVLPRVVLHASEDQHEVGVMQLRCGVVLGEQLPTTASVLVALMAPALDVWLALVSPWMPQSSSVVCGLRMRWKQMLFAVVDPASLISRVAIYSRRHGHLRNLRGDPFFLP